MKNRILTILFVLTLANLAVAQDHVCGVSHADQKEMISFIENFNKTSHHSVTRNTDPIYIPVKFHMVAKNDGTGRVKGNSVLSQMSILIEDYKKLGMYLYIDEFSFNYLNSTAIYENPGTFVPNIIAQKDDNAMNIFICENADTDGGAGTVLGFYSPTGDYIVIRNSDVRDATSSLTHEVGHFFGLPHTFFGWEGVSTFYGWTNGWDVSQFNGQYNSTTCPGNNYPAELMNMSNCTVSGDKICDTPPDYNFGFGTSECFWPNTLKDINGDIIDPQENNIMSYFLTCDEYVFTQGQIDVMFANFNSGFRDYLKSTYIPDTTEIMSNHELLSPAEGEVLEYYTNISLDWTEADGATNYLVSVTSQSGDLQEFYVSDTKLILDELEPNFFYFWEVRPYNDAYTDTDLVNGFFTTGSEINTSVTESELIQNVVVFPNPGRTGQDINVSLSMEESNDVTISLIDMTGRVVTTKTQNLNQGENNVSINAVTESGIYFLKLDSVDGSTYKKVVIQ